MTEFIIGTVGFPIARERMVGRVDMVELTDARRIPPSAKAARHQLEDIPDGLAISVQASQFFAESPPPGLTLKGDPAAYGDFRITSETTALWRRQMDYATALDAMAVVLITPASVTPSTLTMDRMTAFFEQMRPTPRRIIWEPHGPWDHARAAAFAREVGITLAVDPLHDAPGEGEFGYFRFGPFSSMGSRFGVYSLERIVDAAAAFDTVCCVFDTRRSLDDASNLRRLITEGSLDEDTF